MQGHAGPREWKLDLLDLEEEGMQGNIQERRVDAEARDQVCLLVCELHFGVEVWPISPNGSQSLEGRPILVAQTSEVFVETRDLELRGCSGWKDRGIDCSGAVASAQQANSVLGPFLVLPVVGLA
jgi:hypothetical protein